jgi:hypothetical protein
VGAGHNSQIQRRNTINNIRATFTFAHFEEETLKVVGLFGPADTDGANPLTLEKNVDLSQGDKRRLFLLASREQLH